MRFARREGVPQPWRQRVQLCAKPRGTPLWALQTTYPGRRRRLHARAWISDRGLHCHYSVAGAAAACALTIRRDAHDRAGVRRHADARATAQHSTAQHSTALFQCHDCTAAPAALPPALRGCALAQHPAGAASHRIAWATGFHACRVAAAQPRKPTRADVLPVERCSLSRMRTHVGCTAAKRVGGMAAGLGFNSVDEQADRRGRAWCSSLRIGRYLGKLSEEQSKTYGFVTRHGKFLAADAMSIVGELRCSPIQTYSAYRKARTSTQVCAPPPPPRLSGPPSQAVHRR